MHTNELKKVLQEHLGSEVGIELSPEWGSNSPHHRLLIRDHLKANLSSQLDLTSLDLQQRPKFKANDKQQGSISISHCPDFGGYVYSMNHSVGLDIESPRRINKKIIARISKEEEFYIGLNHAQMWTAKESSFKALSNSQLQPKIQIISDIHLINSKSLFLNKTVHDFNDPSFIDPGIHFSDFSIFNAKSVSSDNPNTRNISSNDILSAQLIKRNNIIHGIIFSLHLEKVTLQLSIAVCS